MFSQHYFWYFLFAYFFTFSMDRVLKRDLMLPEITAQIMQIDILVCNIARYIFLIIGFWAMPAWWYPIAFLGCSILAAVIPIGDKIAAFIGIIAAPVLSTLMYLSLFNII